MTSQIEVTRPSRARALHEPFQGLILNDKNQRLGQGTLTNLGFLGNEC